MVADHVTFRDRSALREPAKALRFSREEIDRFIRFGRCGEAAKIPPVLRRVAGRIRGFPRYLGAHPGGGTLGVFYVESPATRQLLAKMRKGDFENMVIPSSIIRPAANRYIREFVRRLHGAGYPPLHPRLEETLRETFGIMVYQEDVSRVAIDLAGFSAGEADRLRKVLTKKCRELRLAVFRGKFFAGGVERGVSPEVIEKVWEMILSFDDYSFCKSHSASYAVVSFKLAWMKRFHPLEFFVSVINNGGGYYTWQTYIDECRRAGFPVLPPDVNLSGRVYIAEYGGAARSAGGAGAVARAQPGVHRPHPGRTGGAGGLRRPAGASPWSSSPSRTGTPSTRPCSSPVPSWNTTR